MGPETVPVDDWPNNVLHSRLHVAADRADRAVDTVGQGGTNPLAGAVSRLSTAWVADGSSARVACSESLLGVGAAIRSAFVAGAHQFRSAWQDEPPTIDVAEHPELDWKTSSARIDSRVWAYSRGYR